MEKIFSGGYAYGAGMSKDDIFKFMQSCIYVDSDKITKPFNGFAFHSTEMKYIENLLKQQKSKVALSSTVNPMYANFAGVATEGGVTAILQGRFGLMDTVDFYSEVDPLDKGRWIPIEAMLLNPSEANRIDDLLQEYRDSLTKKYFDYDNLEELKANNTKFAVSNTKWLEMFREYKDVSQIVVQEVIKHNLAIYRSTRSTTNATEITLDNYHVLEFYSNQEDILELAMDKANITTIESVEDYIKYAEKLQEICNLSFKDYNVKFLLVTSDDGRGRGLDIDKFVIDSDLKEQIINDKKCSDIIDRITIDYENYMDIIMGLHKHNMNQFERLEEANK